MAINKLFIVFIAFLTISCSNSPYVYDEKPTPLKKEQSIYYLDELTVNLTLGDGANVRDGDSSFSNQEEMEKQFKNYINRALKEKNILAPNSSSADATIKIIIDYKRNFNYGGKALNKPLLSHRVNIYKNAKKLAHFADSNYTTKYSYLKDLAVNAEIAAFRWGADDELKDIRLISDSIVNDLYQIGQ